jgi:hypothetical protein
MVGIERIKILIADSQTCEKNYINSDPLKEHLKFFYNASPSPLK